MRSLQQRECPELSRGRFLLQQTPIRVKNNVKETDLQTDRQTIQQDNPGLHTDRQIGNKVRQTGLQKNGNTA